MFHAIYRWFMFKSIPSKTQLAGVEDLAKAHGTYDNPSYRRKRDDKFWKERVIPYGDN